MGASYRGKYTGLQNRKGGLKTCSACHSFYYPIGSENPHAFSCPYCGRMHPAGYVCPKKPKHKWYRKVRGQNERFRSSAAWQKKRIETLERDHYLCRICFEDDHVINNAGLQIHHITSLDRDFEQRLDTNNLITLCPNIMKKQNTASFLPTGSASWRKCPPGFRNLRVDNGPRPYCPTSIHTNFDFSGVFWKDL